jgi:nicotinate phosphoribosyltransferase
LPTSSLVRPLLTDMYQLSMAYGYWRNGKAKEPSVFELFFRVNPFGGEYCIFAGQDEVLRFLSTFKFSESDIAYLRELLPLCDPAFFIWLEELDCSGVTLHCIEDGSVVFPRMPLMRIEGPLAVCQLLETTLLNLVNFPSLVATNAARMRLAAGADKTLIEFGLRRAQGPDGGLSASKYAYLGGFDSTANVLAGKLFGISVKGTHAHAFVMSYASLDELHSRMICNSAGEEVDFLALVLEKRRLLGAAAERSNDSELAAFIAYSQAFPHNFLALVDTYDTLASGVPNFLAVGWALHELGHRPLGVRLDSGDLAYLSNTIRKRFREVDAALLDGQTLFASCSIVASNDINEDILLALAHEGHAIDAFGIGTHLVTCQKQPALGCVYKLVQIRDQPRMKFSEDVEKMLIPGRKAAYRLFGHDQVPLVDLLQTADEPAPVAGQRLLVRHPFAENKRAFVTPQAVVPLLRCVFEQGVTRGPLPGPDTLRTARERCRSQLAQMRNDHVRALNPTPYKISVSQRLYEFMHELWMRELPVKELS